MVLPKEWGVWAPYQSPQPGGPAPGRWAPRTLAWKASETYSCESQRAVGNEIPLLKDAHKTTHTPGPREKAAIWKEPGLDLPADLGESPGEAGGNWSSQWGYKNWKQPFWGAPSTMGTLVLAKAILESSLSLSPSEPSSTATHQPIGTSTGSIRPIN